MIRHFSRQRFFLIAVTFLFACEEKEAQQADRIEIILDTDMGSDCDDVGALALLNYYHNQKDAEIKAVVYSSGKIPYGVGIIHAINKYYGNEGIPIGALYDSTFGDPVDKMLAEKITSETTKYGHSFVSTRDVPEQTSMLREILAKAKDRSITYITIGHTKGLHELVRSNPDKASSLMGEELVNKKIQRWVALGALGANDSIGNYRQDWNFFRNGSAPFTEYLIKNLEIPIYFIDAGTTVMTGSSLVELPKESIVRIAYEVWLQNVENKTLIDQRPSWDLMAVMYAVEGNRGFFESNNKGYLDFDSGLGSRWIKTDSLSNHYFVTEVNGKTDEIASYLNGIISISPNQ